MTATVAALYVEPAGVYATMADVDCWGEDRDARLYRGPHRVVAHPPCARWSRLAGLVYARGGLPRGADGGTFGAALEAVESWGGVLEHPAQSAAFGAYGLGCPLWGCWIRTRRGWVTEVYQSAYGHRADKATWLYLVGQPSLLDWSRPPTAARVSEAHGKQRRAGGRMSRKERTATPRPFAEVLLALVRGELAPGGEQLPLDMPMGIAAL